MSIVLITLRIKYEEDAVLARQRARQIASLLGFDTREQTAIATSVSELVRNAYNYARGGIVEFSIEGKAETPMLSIKVSDNGPGISSLAVYWKGATILKQGWDLESWARAG